MFTGGGEGVGVALGAREGRAQKEWREGCCIASVGRSGILVGMLAGDGEGCWCCCCFWAEKRMERVFSVGGCMVSE